MFFFPRLLLLFIIRKNISKHVILHFTFFFSSCSSLIRISFSRSARRTFFRKNHPFWATDNGTGKQQMPASNTCREALQSWETENEERFVGEWRQWLSLLSVGTWDDRTSIRPLATWSPGNWVQNQIFNKKEPKLGYLLFKNFLHSSFFKSNLFQFPPEVPLTEAHRPSPMRKGVVSVWPYPAAMWTPTQPMICQRFANFLCKCIGSENLEIG